MSRNGPECGSEASHGSLETVVPTHGYEPGVFTWAWAAKRGPLTRICGMGLFENSPKKAKKKKKKRKRKKFGTKANTV